jgi:hypothetical protein
MFPSRHERHNFIAPSPAADTRVTLVAADAAGAGAHQAAVKRRNQIRAAAK